MSPKPAKACRRCGANFVPFGNSTVCGGCLDEAMRNGVKLRIVCGRCLAYGHCTCDLCGMPSTHVGENPMPTFRCPECIDRERNAYERRKDMARRPNGRGRQE